MLVVRNDILLKASEGEDVDPLIATRATHIRQYSSDGTKFSSADLTDDVVLSLLTAADDLGDKSFVRVLDSIQRSREGDFSKSIPSFDAAVEAIKAYLQHHFIDGWLYKRSNADGVLAAFLVTGVEVKDSRDGSDRWVQVNLAYTGGTSASRGGSSDKGSGVYHQSIQFTPSEVTRKKVQDILLSKGYLIETTGLRAEYDQSVARFVEVLNTGFAKQFLFTGVAMSDDWSYGRDFERQRTRRKVIDDLHPREITIATEALSHILPPDYVHPDEQPATGKPRRSSRRESERMGALPVYPFIRVFDLHSQDTLWVHVSALTDYVYDDALRTKLVLPEQMHDLLDILTTDVDSIVGDIIEGKAAGNVILTQGVPGVGKTLTAEVYAETLHLPLYSIHSGSLGTSADSVRKSLEAVFKRAERWGCVLLLDEADVFVIERGNDINQNAIVAEFLRTLEYFPGLMFMTTNRANQIDEAILSRTAAHITYAPPVKHDAVKVWRVMADNFGVGEQVSDDLLEHLSEGFAKAAPRDIKMLMRLVVRVAKSKDLPLDYRLFERYATFRGMRWDEDKAGQWLIDNASLPYVKNLTV